MSTDVMNKGIRSMRVLLIRVKPRYRAVLTILIVVKKDKREPGKRLSIPIH